MIKLKQENYSTAVVLVCDVCSKLIERAEDGEYLIPRLAEGEYSDMLAGHYPCTKAYEAAAYQIDKTTFGNMPLDALVIYLGNNLKIHWNESTKRLALLARLAA